MSSIPKVPANNYRLIDSEQRSTDHPDSWGHTPQDVLDQIEPGYLVKVGVTHPELDGERFWGLVKEKNGANIVIQVDQDMLYTDQHGVMDQDVLIVQEQNIFGVMDATGVPLWVANATK